MKQYSFLISRLSPHINMDLVRVYEFPEGGQPVYVSPENLPTPIFQEIVDNHNLIETDSKYCSDYIMHHCDILPLIRTLSDCVVEVTEVNFFDNNLEIKFRF